jgi:hypothetical protein
MPGCDRTGLDQLKVEPELGPQVDTREFEADARSGVIKAGAADGAIARAGGAPLGRDEEERVQRLHVVVPDPGFGVIGLVFLKDQSKAQGVIFRLVTGPPFLPKRPGCPGAAGPCQFPRRAFDIASV